LQCRSLAVWAIEGAGNHFIAVFVGQLLETSEVGSQAQEAAGFEKPAIFFHIIRTVGMGATRRVRHSV
jgi:hypothetical protein